MKRLNEQMQPASEAEKEAIRVAAKRIDRVTAWLQLGGAWPSEEIYRLRDAGITHVVDLRAEYQGPDDTLAAMGIQRRHVPVVNFTAPTLEQLREVGRWIDESAGDCCVYVHCGSGVGRAATMAVALLVHSGIALDQALSRVRQVRPEIRINDEQMAWLRSLEENGAAAK